MDELHQLYEHQTMMAIGIYSFLDNLLAHIPPHPELNADTAPNTSEQPEIANETEPNRMRSDRNEFSGGLLDFGRTSDITRERPERIRLFPRFSTWSIHTGLSPRSDVNVDHSTDALVEPRLSEDALRPPESSETINKVDVTPGGYPEEIFIYLSDREKHEYMCTICYSVLKEAYQCPNEHRFCYGCIYTWSTGPSVGHDGCPVCRCDGLYAKNFDLVERINRKRVRCPIAGCNWMGVLSEYGTHEHRRYSPYELDILISSCSKETLMKTGKTNDESAKQESSLEESVRQNSPTKPEHAIVTEVVTDGAELRPLVGLMPATCEPVTTSLEETEPNAVIRNQPTRGLSRLRRRTGSSGDLTTGPTSGPSHIRHSTHTRRNTNTTGMNSAVMQSRPNRVPTPSTPTRIPGGHPSHTPMSMPNIPRPLVTSRNARATTRTTSSVSQNSEHTSRPVNVRPRRSIHQTSRNLSRQSYSSSESDLQGADTTRQFGSRNEQVSNSTMPNRETTPAGRRDRNETDRTTEPTITTIEHVRAHVTSPPPVISTESPPSSTFLAARDQMFPIRSAGEGVNHSLAQRRNASNIVETGTSDRRSESCVLPAINPTATLTTGLSGRTSYEQSANSQLSSTTVRGVVETSIDQGHTEPAESSGRRPLEFRRLVPRRQGRVVEQLRETREQLAAMLRLMTMELEERRQHVIAATLETATRGRILRNLNNTESSVERGSTSTMTEQQNVQDQQNNNPSSSWNVLRNLPTPDRSYTTQRLPLRLLRFTAGTEDQTTVQHDYTPDRWAAYPTLTDPALVTSSQTGEGEQGDEEEGEEDRPNRSMSSVLPSRLLTRLRVGSVTRPPAPPILLVSRRRNLSTLLSELRYANGAAYGGWSSDDDEGEDPGQT